MLVGVDASRSTARQRTGIEAYSLQLIRGLLANGSEHRYRLYFNRAPDPGLFGPGAEHRVIPFPYLWTHARLSWEMAVRQPDLLFVPAHVLPLVHPRRSVVTVHDLGFLYHPEAHTLFQNLYLRWSTRHNAAAAACVLADSQATRRDLVDRYAAAPDRIVVVYPGRDESLAPVTERGALVAVLHRYGLSESYLLYVGTLQPRKNLVRLIQAFAQARPRLDPSLQLVLAGRPGWMFHDIVAQVERLGLTGRVLLPGFVPDADLPPLLSGALAFVFPSLYEGFGFPVLEAMACGTPVLCSNRSSLPEVAGDAALLVDPLDPDALVDGLERIVNDDGLRRELVGRGFANIQRFSWQRAARQVLEVFREVERAVP